MLDHLSLGVSDIARSVAFYDAVLAPLGYVQVFLGERFVGYGIEPPDEKLALIRVEGAVASGPGTHLAITAPSREAVDGFHAAALRAGGTDEGAPGPRPKYGEHYYAAFVRDPDGHKLEAVCHEPPPA